MVGRREEKLFDGLSCERRKRGGITIEGRKKQIYRVCAGMRRVFNAFPSIRSRRLFYYLNDNRVFRLFPLQSDISSQDVPRR